MNFEQIKTILFDKAKELGLAEYDVYFKMSSSVDAEALKKEPSTFSSGTVGGVSFRCAVDGKLGTAATQSLDPDDLAGLVPRAMANAGVLDTDEAPIFFDGSTAYQKLDTPDLTLPDAAVLRRAAMQVQEQLYAESKLATDATASGAGAATTTLCLANSKGLSLSHSVASRYIWAEAVLDDGKEPSSGMAFSGKLEEAADVAKRANAEALGRMGAGTVKTGTYDVIFSAREMRSLLSAFSGIFSGKNALLGLSLLAGKEGEKVAAECLTLVDDPFYAENSVKMPFDAEGVATSEKKLIENGVLNTLLYDLTYAKKAGKTTTANAARGSVDAPVSIAPYCLRVEPGELSEQELMTIMEGFLGGSALRATEKLGPVSDVKELAIRFILYGTLSEIFARDTGFHKGMGGSMHAFFIPFGLMPNNAIVGASAPIALGAALYKRSNNKPGITSATAPASRSASGKFLKIQKKGTIAAHTPTS